MTRSGRGRRAASARGDADRLIERRDSKLLLISTAAAQLDSPLGRLRARALAQSTAKRTGPVDLHWLEWSVPDDVDLDDLDEVKKADPAPWITIPDLRRQRAAVPATAFAQCHACRWGVGEGSWLPPGACQSCVGTPTFVPGEDVYIGVDVGGERSASAVVYVSDKMHVGCGIHHGDAGVLGCVDHVRSHAGRFNVRELIYDPWRFGPLRRSWSAKGSWRSRSRNTTRA